MTSRWIAKISRSRMTGKLSRRPISTRRHLEAIHVRHLRIRHPQERKRKIALVARYAPALARRVERRELTPERAIRIVVAELIRSEKPAVDGAGYNASGVWVSSGRWLATKRWVSSGRWLASLLWISIGHWLVRAGRVSEAGWLACGFRVSDVQWR